MDSEKIMTELQSLTDNLLYISESEALWELADLGEKNEGETIEEFLEEKTGLERASLKKADLDAFFKPLIESYDSADEIMEQMAERYRQLLDFLVEHFCRLCLFKSGEVHIDIFLVAETNKGHVVALQTSAVET